MRPPVHPWARRVALGALAVLLLLYAPSSGNAQNTPQDAAPLPRDIVVLIDVSTSIEEIFPAMQKSLREFVAGARFGDSISLVQFSDSVRTIDGRLLVTSADRDRLQAEISALKPEGHFTNITGALARASHLLRAARRAPGGEERVQFMLLITDGRHNPPASAHAPTFDDILERYSDFRPGHDWFVHYVAVGGVMDDAALGFAQRAQGQVTLLGRDQLDDLAGLLDNLQIPSSIRVQDLMGPVDILAVDGSATPARVGQSLRAGMRIRTGPRGRAIVHIGEHGYIGLDPGTRVTVQEATDYPVLQSHRVRLHVSEGRVWALVHRRQGPVDFAMESPHATVHVTGTFFMLDASPTAGNTRVLVAEGKVQVLGASDIRPVSVGRGLMTLVHSSGNILAPKPLTTPLRSTQHAWRAALADHRRLHDLAQTFAELAWQSLAVELGPVEPGRTYHKSIKVDLGMLTAADLDIAVEGGRLPHGLTLTAAVHPPTSANGEALTAVEIAVHAAPEGPARAEMTYVRKLRLLSPTFPQLADMTFPVRITTASTIVVPSGLPARTPILWWLAAGSVGLPIIGFLLRGWWSQRGMAVPLGRLLLRKNPAPADWSVSSLDLEALCRQKDIDVITIGSTPDNVISLPDPLVLAHHAELRVRGRRHANRRLFLHVLPKARVKIGSTTVKAGAVEILDGMLIRFGNFVFQYEDSRNAEQVEVALRDRRLIHGVLRSWDLTAPTFTVSYDDHDLEATETPERIIAFVEIEDISILRGETQSRKGTRARRAARGPRASIKMKSGRRHEGWVRQDYSLTSKRFYFFPAARPNVDYMIVETESVADIDVEDRG